MADITQRLGFDTSGGVSALNNLQQAIDGVNQSLRNLNTARVSGVNKSLGNLNKQLGQAGTAAAANSKVVKGFAQGATPAINSAAQSLGGLNQGFNNVATSAAAADKSSRGAIAGFALLGAAKQGLSSIVGLLLEAADASREFQQSIAEVSTISGLTTTIDGLSQKVRELSVEFGKPTVEVAEAAYQAFSNQVIQTSADMDFLVQANQLAIASASDLDTAVQALSSVINSYGLEASDAARISDVLFKGIEEGRFRLDEIGNSLGTVTTLANSAGVGLNEVVAGLDVITKSGTTASVAMTQVRGILAKILKPTESMSAAFAKFGATDGPSAIKAAGGLGQLINKLQVEAEASGVSLVKMFGRIRGGQGALNLAANEGKDFAKILEELDNSAGAAQKAFERIDGTDAREAEKAFNELKVTVEELGDAVVPVITKLVQGINSVIPDGKTLGVVLAGAAAALLVVGAAAVTLVAAFLPLTTVILPALAPFAPLLIVIAAATAGVLAAQKLLNDEIKAGTDARLAESQAALQSAKDQTAAAEKTAASLKEGAAEAAAEVIKQFGTIITAAKKADADSKKSFQSTIAAFADSRKAVIKDLKDSIKNAESEIAASGQRLKGIQQELADIKFDEATKNLTGQAKVQALLNRAVRSGIQARKDFANAGQDAEKQREALAARATTREQLAAAERAAAATETTVDDRMVAEQKKRFLKGIEADEKKFAAAKEKFKKDETARIKEAEEAIKRQVTEVQNLTGEYQELVSSVDGTGKLKGPKQLKADFEASRDVLKEINDLIRQDPTGGLAKQVGSEDKLAEGNQQLIDGVVNFEQNQAQIRANLQKVLDSGAFQAQVVFDKAVAEADIIVSETRTKEKVAALQADLQKQLEAQKLNVVIDADQGPIETFAQQVAGTFLGLTTDIQTASGFMGAFRQAIQDTTVDVANLDQAGIDGAKEALQKIEDSIKNTNVSDAGAKQLKTEIEGARAILDTQAGVIELKSKVTDDKAKDLPKSLGNAATQARNLATPLGTSATASGTVKSNTAALSGQISSAIGPANALASALERAARARAKATGGGGAQTAFFGKQIHRQTGGFTRGQDRILTSTAPGEFVMNAKTTRRMRSELTAINANQSPQFRETGGAVTNVGDINVNINSADTGAVQGRSIARDLKRELRTRTSSL